MNEGDNILQEIEIRQTDQVLAEVMSEENMLSRRPLRFTVSRAHERWINC